VLCAQIFPGNALQCPHNSAGEWMVAFRADCRPWGRVALTQEISAGAVWLAESPAAQGLAFLERVPTEWEPTPRHCSSPPTTSKHKQQAVMLGCTVGRASTLDRRTAGHGSGGKKCNACVPWTRNAWW